MARARAQKSKKDTTEQDAHLKKLTVDAMSDPHADLLNLQQAAGNQAVNAKVTGELPSHVQDATRSSGRPLEPGTKAEVEAQFQHDFDEVRLHTDLGAKAQADELGAQAFTSGDDIVLGSEAPDPQSPAGRELLAHELTHVVQQRQATSVDEEQMSQPDDRSERAAGAAAQEAMHGGTIDMPAEGSVPAVQRQERVHVTRAEAQTALEAYLRRELAAQGGQTLRVTPRIRQTVESLFAGDIGRQLGIQTWLANPVLPGNPAEFASQVARRLPDRVDAARVRRLADLPASERTTRLGRVGRLIERTAPGGPAQQEEDEARRVARGQVDPEDVHIPRRHTRPPGPTPQERLEQLEQIDRAVRGEEEPTQIGPIPIDVLRVGRIIRGLPEALRQSRRPQPEARTYRQVEQGIQQLVRPDALIPAEATRRLQRAERDFEMAGPDEENLRRLGLRDARAAAESFANAQDVARGLARRLDIAHRRGQDTVTLRLGENYRRIRNRRTIYSELDRIARIVRSRLPHRAAAVRYVEVYFGDRIARRINLERTQAQEDE